MKTAILLLFIYLISPSLDVGVSLFLYDLGTKLDQFEEIKSKKKIPKRVFKTINSWKEKYIFSHYEEPLTKQERKFLNFTMANVNRPYNWGCVPTKGLPYRQLRFAGKLGSKYFISYNHGQGRCHNNKLLYIDLDKPDELSVFYINYEVNSFEDLKIQLKEMSEFSNKEFDKFVYLFEGKPFSDWLDFDRISF